MNLGTEFSNIPSRDTVLAIEKSSCPVFRELEVSVKELRQELSSVQTSSFFSASSDPFSREKKLSVRG